MKTEVTAPSFDAVLGGSSREVKDLARRLRRLIIGVYPQVIEVAWPKQRIVGFGVGPRKMTEHFCYIALFRSHVNLGFFHGAALADPAGVLEGTGKELRHVKLTTPAEVERPVIRRLISESLKERRKALSRLS